MVRVALRMLGGGLFGKKRLVRRVVAGLGVIHIIRLIRLIQGIRELMVRVSRHPHVHAHLMTTLHVLHLLHLHALHVLLAVLRLHTLSAALCCCLLRLWCTCVCTLMARSCMTMHSARASLVTRVPGAEGVPKREVPAPPNRRLLILKEQRLIYGRLAGYGGPLWGPVQGSVPGHCRRQTGLG